MEEIDPGPHTIRWYSLWVPLVYLSLSLPRLTVTILRVNIVEVLRTIGLFLSTWRSLPLLELLEHLAIHIVYGHDWLWLAETLSDECLQFVLNFWLLLLQIV